MQNKLSNRFHAYSGISLSNGSIIIVTSLSGFKKMLNFYSLHFAAFNLSVARKTVTHLLRKNFHHQMKLQLNSQNMWFLELLWRVTSYQVHKKDVTFPHNEC